MERLGVPQLHIIPFDLGCAFFDCLSLNNSKNLKFADKFVAQLTSECASLGITVENNMTLSHSGKMVTGVKYKKNTLSEQAICFAKITPRLFCFILATGTGIFLLSDFEDIALKDTDPAISKCNKALIANYQKKIAQATILNKYKGEDVFPEEEKKMLEFRELCWKLVSEGAKRGEIMHLRKYTGAKTYKNDGLSYVLTIYLLTKGEMTKNEIDHLMMPSLFSRVTDQSRWEAINSAITTLEAEEAPAQVPFGETMTYYSWSAVAVESPKAFANVEEAFENTAVADLIKAELYVQSRWFIADNSMDNVNKNSDVSMEKLQRLASLIEFYQAELDNEISANMNTFYKRILAKVVKTSEVKQLYKSVLSQITTQKKIKEAHYQDKKRKNKLIADLFLAVFTASSLYKTVSDLIKGEFTWVNWLIFGAMMLVAVGTIIFNYRNR